MNIKLRQSLLLGFVSIAFLLIITRLFYWQVVRGSELAEAGVSQYYFALELAPRRGEMLASDKSPMVTNQAAYLAYSEPQKIDDKRKFADSVAQVLEMDQEQVYKRITQENIVWATLKHKVDEIKKKELETLGLDGIGFEVENKRLYPEGSMAAHLLGFVGSDENGYDKGYFGLEGYYDRALKGKSGSLLQEKDARGLPMLLGAQKRISAHDGQSLELYIDRSIQFIVEEQLKQGLKRYGAKAGLIAIIDPKTGGLIASATYPNFDPAKFLEHEGELYPNPLVSQTYEPGSTFKALVMAATLNERLLTPTTTYNESGPVRVGEYSIRTWNDKYNGILTMTQVLEKSSNPGMVYVGSKLGINKLSEYMRLYGFGAETGIDLQGEEIAKMRDVSEWKEIDLATASFGQGIAVTPIQMLRAFASLANDGVLLKPLVVKRLIDPSGEVIEIASESIREVIRPATSRIITEMLVSAVDNGEAKWAKPPGYRIAGKTGTAQIPVSGHYDTEKTIASFIGYAPADNPKFVMLVMLNEPSSSPWGSETAAPLFFAVTKELFAYYGISPKG